MKSTRTDNFFLGLIFQWRSLNFNGSPWIPLPVVEIVLSLRVNFIVSVAKKLLVSRSFLSRMGSRYTFPFVSLHEKHSNWQFFFRLDFSTTVVDYFNDCPWICIVTSSELFWSVSEKIISIEKLFITHGFSIHFSFRFTSWKAIELTLLFFLGFIFNDGCWISMAVLGFHCRLLIFQWRPLKS